MRAGVNVNEARTVTAIATPSTGPKDRSRPSSAAAKAKNPKVTVAPEATIVGDTAAVAVANRAGSLRSACSSVLRVSRYLDNTNMT